jgi:hypothetical protein
MATVPAPTNTGSKIALALLPTTHVSFSTDPALAWGRVLLYGTAAYLLWGKVKPASYVAMAGAGLCLLSSLSNPVSFADPYAKTLVMDAAQVTGNPAGPTE